LEVVAALLQELLILSSVLRLLRLLLESARANLRLSALQCSLLRASAKPGKLLGRSGPHRVALLTKRSKLLGCLSALTILLLTKALNSLTDAKSLSIEPLTKPLQLLTSLLNSGAICLFSLQSSLLLLLGNILGLLIALLIKRSDNLACRKSLLTTQSLTL
jgi:hypothetical protein